MNRIICRAAVIAALSLSASLWGCEKDDEVPLQPARAAASIADQNRELSLAIRELAERCTPAVGSARAEVERVFGAGRAGFPDDVKLSKADRARGPDAAGRYWRYALGEDELRVTYDAATRSVVERAEYFDPNRENGRAEAPTADETHAELVQRLAQMKRIAAAFEQRARR